MSTEHSVSKKPEWSPEPEGFLARNLHLVENYLAVCAALEMQPGEVPEACGAISHEMPSERAVRYFQRLHGLPEVGYVITDTKTGKPVAVNPDTGKWETVG